jgi:hypothetical protein
MSAPRQSKNSQLLSFKAGPMESNNLMIQSVHQQRQEVPHCPDERRDRQATPAVDSTNQFVERNRLSLNFRSGATPIHFGWFQHRCD